MGLTSTGSMRLAQGTEPGARPTDTEPPRDMMARCGEGSGGGLSGTSRASSLPSLSMQSELGICEAER